MSKKCEHPDCQEDATKVGSYDGKVDVNFCEKHYNEQWKEVKRMTKIGSFLRKLGDKADILQPKAEKAAIKVGKGLKEAGRKVAVVSLKGSLKVTTEISNLLTKIQPKPEEVPVVCKNNGTQICNLGYACDGCPLNVTDNAQEEHESA